MKLEKLDEKLKETDQNCVRMQADKKKNPCKKYRDAAEAWAICEPKYKDGKYTSKQEFLEDLSKCYDLCFQEWIRKVEANTTWDHDPTSPIHT